jgi:serine/threonine protein phosphatase PrpC
MVFGVFDGHGGGAVSKFVKRHFVNFLVKNKLFKEGNYAEALRENFLVMDYIMTTKKGLESLKRIYDKEPKPQPMNVQNMNPAMLNELMKGVKKPSIDAFKEDAGIEEKSDDYDEELQDFASQQYDLFRTPKLLPGINTEATRSSLGGGELPEPYNNTGEWVSMCMGCTANVVIVTPDQIICGNLGDSRSVLARVNGEVVPLSIDHKPEDKVELDRITKAGGYV